jgi:4-aminobutyrate aminotransferase-like enzyme
MLRSSRYGKGSVIKIRPPLITRKDQVDEILERLTRVLQGL